MLRVVFDCSPQFRSRRCVRHAAAVSLVLAVLATSIAPWHPAAAVRAADVTITGTTVGEPQLGQGGTFTVTTTGTISSGGEGIVADPANGITQLFVEGVVDAFSQGFNNNAGSGVQSASVNGRVSGGSHGVLNGGTIGTFSIALGEVSSGGGTGLRNSGTMQLLDIGAPEESSVSAATV
jgi:hypothetical protein